MRGGKGCWLRGMTKFLTTAAISAMTASLAAAHPADQWEFTLESGYLWNVGDNTPIDYEIIPTQFTFRSPVMWSLFDGADGSRLVVRNRFAAVFETITVGPEDYYIGASAAPSLEYWFPSAKTSVFFSIGGGIGWTNSSGGEGGGMGQDFTLNWFSQLGIRQALTEDLSLLGGAYFVHHSNGGMTDPNPGIDALGFTVGLGWKF